jgi:serine/threonine protein kinase
LLAEDAEPYFDMWSLGVSIFRLMTREYPFNIKSQGALLDSIRASEGKQLDMPGHFSSDLRNLVSSLLTVKPQKRLTIE